ncbi:MAG TPA: hypothetical protein VHA33_25455 [Candidatus Angelobacter sp.]|jgi:hypothetical protein|nr:hypothetical protein [Candidatus Angelobacter sp.]
MRVSSPIFAFSVSLLLVTPFAKGQGSGTAQPPRTVSIGAGVPIHVVLDKRVSFTKVGRQLRGHIAQPVYVYDQVAIPAGTTVLGRVAEVHAVARRKRVDALLGGDFTPLREAQVEFDKLIFADGHELAFESTGAARDSAVVRMTPPSQKGLWQQTKSAVRNAVVTQKQNVEDMIRKPHKMERLKNGLLAKLPYHPQVFDEGTQFVAELKSPIEVQAPFLPSTEAPRTEDLVAKPPVNTVLHARLSSELSSATNQREDPVEAVLTEPVYSADHHLLLPEGTHLLGTVLAATPAKRLGQNGELRFTFKEVQLASGAKVPMRGQLSAADASKAGNITIDEEGGAHATESRAKYLVPLAIVLLAQTTAEGDEDGIRGNGGGSVNNGVAGGGFGLMGRLLALSAGSRFVAYGIGYYGAAHSIYSRFIARGHDVVFPRDTQIEITVGSR